MLRGSTAGGPYTQIAELTPRTTVAYTDNPAAGTYYYIVRGFYQNWESVNSNEASASLTANTWYLHNNPTPPTGDTVSQLNLPLNQTAPTASTLYNYDTNRDANAGMLLPKGGTGASESDTNKYQNWQSSALGSALLINGTVNVRLWSAMKNFATSTGGTVEVFLRNYNGSTYTEICNGALTDTTWQDGTSSWVLKTVSFSCGSYTIPAGNRLEIKIIVSASSADDMWFAYDTATYDSRLELP